MTPDERREAVERHQGDFLVFNEEDIKAEAAGVHVTTLLRAIATILTAAEIER